METTNVLNLLTDFINQDPDKPFNVLKDTSEVQNYELLTKEEITLSTNHSDKLVFITLNGTTPNDPDYHVTDHYILDNAYEVYYLERNEY